MKKILAAMTAALMMVALAGSALAAPPTTSLMGQAWKVYNVKPATSSFWDINKVKLSGGALSFPIAQFATTTTGSFAVYLSDNYNVSLTSAQTLSTTASWTSGTYATRSTCDGAFGRIWFQDVTSGPYNSNDYWWYSGQTLDLHLTSGEIAAPLSDRVNWTNLDGRNATDTTVPWESYLGTQTVSPSDGFDKAMKNVKQLGLAFGSSCAYASGIALVGGTGTFTMSSFTITP